jgi:hypothetical protein
MEHRHVAPGGFTLAAIDDVISRGSLAEGLEWRGLGSKIPTRDATICRGAMSKGAPLPDCDAVSSAAAFNQLTRGSGDINSARTCRLRAEEARHGAGVGIAGSLRQSRQGRPPWPEKTPLDDLAAFVAQNPLKR